MKQQFFLKISVYILCKWNKGNENTQQAKISAKKYEFYTFWPWGHPTLCTIQNMKQKENLIEKYEQ